MSDTQMAPIAGAGINPRVYEADSSIAVERQKHEPHYVFAPGESLCLSDRQLCIAEVLRGRIMLVQDHTYLERNRSDEYIKGNEPSLSNYTKSAADSAREIESSFNSEGNQKAFVIKSLTGAAPEQAALIESVLVPELPATVKKFVTHLLTKARINLESSELRGEELDKAEAARKEMLSATRRVLVSQGAYLDKTERELINSRKPGGRGKSSLDSLDKQYYYQCERKVPLETDLDFIAGQEASPAKAGPSALEKSLSLIAEKLGGSEDKHFKEDLVATKAELAEIKDRFNQVLDMLERGEVAPKKKQKAS